RVELLERREAREHLEHQAQILAEQLALLLELAAVLRQRLGADDQVADLRRVAGQLYAHIDQDRALALQGVEGLVPGRRDRGAGALPLVRVGPDAETPHARAEPRAEA